MLGRFIGVATTSSRSFTTRSATIAPFVVGLPSLWSTATFATNSETADAENRALLDYFTKLDAEAAAAYKPEAPLPIKVSGISGGLAADLFRAGKSFDGAVQSLTALVGILDESPEVVARFFRHPNYSPEECQAVVELLFTNKESLKKFDAIKDDELREVIVQSPDEAKNWLATRDSIKAAKVSAPAKELVDKLAGMARLDLIRRVTEITQQIKAAQSNTVAVTVASAVELSAAQKKSVTSALPQYLEDGQGVDVTFEVEPGTLGGIMITMGNRSIDLTAGTRLMEAMQDHA